MVDAETRETQIDALRTTLGDLAAQWRAFIGSEEDRAAVAQKYAAVFHQLMALGWDSVIDFEDELPDDAMPPEYIQKHPSQAANWGDPNEFYKNTIR